MMVSRVEEGSYGQARQLVLRRVVVVVLVGLLKGDGDVGHGG